MRFRLPALNLSGRQGFAFLARSIPFLLTHQGVYILLCMYRIISLVYHD